MNMLKTKGLVAAPVTGFREDSNINVEVVGPFAAHLQKQGVSGVFVNGTTGEGMSLTVEEREALAAEWRRVLPAPMKLFVHAGHTALGDAERLARHAVSIGADAVAVMAPGFFKPAGVEGVVDWCERIAGSCPDLPFYYYHMPSMNGVEISVADFLEQAEGRISNLAGIKFTHYAMDDYLAALRFDGGRFDVLWGRDEMLLGALAMGCEGAVGSTYSIFAPLFLDLMRAFRAGQQADAGVLQARARTLIRILSNNGCFFSALKAVLRAQGVPISAKVRVPLNSLTPDAETEVVHQIGNTWTD